jgi:hypothetical protein
MAERPEHGIDINRDGEEDIADAVRLDVLSHLGPPAEIRLKSDQSDILVTTDLSSGINFGDVQADLHDANGRLVNPGTDGVDPAPLTLTLRSTGSGFFYDHHLGEISSTEVNINAFGSFTGIGGRAVEEVQVTASMPGLPDSDPLTIRVHEEGGITGHVRILENDEFRDALPSEFTVIPYPDELHVVGSQNRGMEHLGGGDYLSSGLPAGVYSVVIVPFFLPPPGTGEVNHRRVTVEGVIVESGQVTEGVDADLIPYVPTPGAARLHGHVVNELGEPLLGLTILDLRLVDLAVSDPAPFSLFTEVSSTEAFYEFTELPAGRFSLPSAYEPANVEVGPGYFWPVFSSRSPEITLAEGEDRELNLMLTRVIPATAICPRNAMRVAAPLSFRWSVPENSPSLIFNITVREAGEPSAPWHTQVEGTEVGYGGPPLPKDRLLGWSVGGESADGRYVVEGGGGTFILDGP